MNMHVLIVVDIEHGPVEGDASVERSAQYLRFLWFFHGFIRLLPPGCRVCRTSSRRWGS